MTDNESRQLKAALLKCVDENENKPTFTGNVVVSSICRAAMKRIEELERQVADLSHDKKMLEEGYVYEDYDPGEGCYDDTHEGKWVRRWEPWRYVKDELPKIEVGYKVAVEVCYLNAYQNPCKIECDWNGKDFIYQHFDGKKWIFDKKVSLLGKVFAWRYEVDDWPTPPKEEV